jgi:hypothetical protein
MEAQSFWIASALTVAVFSGLLTLLVRKLLAGESQATDAIGRVSSDYYKPMSRLLADEEFRRVTTAGFTARQVKQLRASRRRVFRQYLIELQGDFRALHQEARIILRDSSEDRPDLAVELVRQYAAFHYLVAAAHCRLAADSLGLSPADAKSLLEPVQWMHQQVELLRMPMPDMA